MTVFNDASGGERSTQMTKTLRTTLQTAAAVLFVLGSSQQFSVCLAQDRGDVPKIAADERDFETRSNILRGIAEHKAKPNEARSPTTEQVMAEARADYMGMQIANKALKQQLAAGTPLDLQFVSNSVSDIRKRAEKLSTNLAFPEPEKDAKRLKIGPARSHEELRASLDSLTTLIRSFVTNPCFRASSLVNSADTRKARLDLEDIMALSKQLQKDNKKLQKAATKKTGE
jgi:hypothetical protein